MKQTHTGGCHCCAVRFSAEFDATQEVLECNCSHCEKKGMLLAFVPETDFELLNGEDELSEYRFNTKTIAHQFCGTCGVQAFGRGESPAGKMVAINLRCVDGIDVENLPRKKVNGKDF